MRIIIIANGILEHPPSVQQEDVLIAADGGARHCLEIGLTPVYVIGDMDSLSEDDIRKLESQGSKLIYHPARKDFTDLELALSYARHLGAQEILVYAALGARWDQTLANLLLPASEFFADIRIHLIDGPQEIQLLRGGESRLLSGRPGDIVSLIPIGGDVHGVTTKELEYPLYNERLQFGSTRGISNVMLGDRATESLRFGNLVCVLIHSRKDENDKGGT